MGLVSTLSTPHCNKYSMSSGRVLPVTAIMGFRNPISERIFLAASGPCISVITESSRMQSKGSLLLRMASKAVTPSSASTIVQLNSLPPVKIGVRFHRLRLKRERTKGIIPLDSSMRRVIFLFICESSTTSKCNTVLLYSGEATLASLKLFAFGDMRNFELRSPTLVLEKSLMKHISSSVGSNKANSKKKVVPNPTPAEWNPIDPTRNRAIRVGTSY